MLLAAHHNVTMHSTYADPAVTATTAAGATSASASASSFRAHVGGTQQQQPHRLQLAFDLQLTASAANKSPVCIMRNPMDAVSVQEKMLAGQLAYLASQHHTSEYCRYKFGFRGSPTAYVPMSIEQPEHVRQLQRRQSIQARQKAWWTNDGTGRSSSQIGPVPQSGIPTSCSMQLIPMKKEEVDDRIKSLDHPNPPLLTPQEVDLQQELSAAMASLIPSSVNPAMVSLVVPVTKTSDTHPINISMIIPFEFLPTVASQLSVPSRASPFMFHLPKRYCMDYVTSIPYLGSHTFPPSFAFSGGTFSNSNSHVPHFPSSFQQPLQVQSGIVSYVHTQDLRTPPPVFWSQQPNGHGTELLKMALDECTDETASAVNNVQNLARKEDARLDSTTGGFAFQPPSTPPPPFFVPSQQAPSRRLMTESPPVPINIDIQSRLLGQPFAYTVENTLVPPLPSPSPPAVESTGVIRRPKHDRALSAPPSFGFGFNQGQKRVGRPLMRNASNLEVPSSAYPSYKIVLPQPRPHPERPAAASIITNAAQEGATVPDLRPNLPRSLASSAAIPSLRPSLPEKQEPIIQQLNLQSRTPTPGERDAVNPIPTPPLNPFDCSLAPLPPAVAKLGNLYLSSCPGKKVRLSGPVKGRGSICRDLRQDLQRIKDLGVGCIICCLDDAELSYLGSPWSHYSPLAAELGLDVLRLPTPEGLAPLDPAKLDRELDRVMKEYTLKGANVLVHCRGGVGRAGIIACCWMVKLGLCGWKEDVEACSCIKCASRRQSVATAKHNQAGKVPPTPSTSSSATAKLAEALQHSASLRSSNNNNGWVAPSPPVCYATLRLVERVIAVVRRRRSLKAVETYEQVKFLVDFVEYLESKSASTSASGSISQSPPPSAYSFEENTN